MAPVIRPLDPVPALVSGRRGIDAWRVLEQLQNAPKGHNQPIGAVIYFVTDLVNRLVNHERVEKELKLRLVGRQERGFVRPLQVALEERDTVPDVPKLSPRFENRHIIPAYNRGFTE